MDLYQKYINPGAGDKRVVAVGRWATAAIVVVACLWAPIITQFKGVFSYIQEIWGFITPGIVAAFLVGMIIKRAPAIAAKTAMILGLILYALFRIPGWILESCVRAGEITKGTFWYSVYSFSTIAFLHHMGIIFLILAATMLIITWRAPCPSPKLTSAPTGTGTWSGASRSRPRRCCTSSSGRSVSAGTKVADGTMIAGAAGSGPRRDRSALPGNRSLSEITRALGHA